MKKILLALTLLFSSCAFAGSELELNKVKLPEAISLIYSEVLKVPYMLDPQLVNDERMITFRLTPDIDEREFVTRYLGNMNIRIWTKKGVDFIAPYTPKEPVKPRYTWTYTPQYRSVAYLSDILGGYVSGSFNNSGAVISDDSLKGSSGASNYINRTGDILVYYGTKEDIAILKTLVTSLDTMSDEVVVSGYVFEVQTSQSDGSGILLAAKILSDKFNISVGAAGLDNFINIRTGSIDAIFNLLKTDSRFTVVSAPRLRVNIFSVMADSARQHSSGLIMEKFMTHQELKVMLLKDPAFRAAYEAESQNPQSGYQIIRHHGDGTEEVVFDSRVSGTDLPTNWMNRPDW